MNMQQELTSLRELFMLFEDPKDKFVQLMDMAKESGQLKENEKVERNKINGCTSRAWVVTEQNHNPVILPKKRVAKALHPLVAHAG